MSAYQQALYEGALATLREQRETNPSAQLQALLAIRKICSDPHGFAEPDTRHMPIESARERVAQDGMADRAPEGAGRRPRAATTR